MEILVDFKEFWDRGWGDADRISEAVFDLVAHEMERKVRPTQILAGLVMGLMTYMKSAEGITSKPHTFVELENAAEDCLISMVASLTVKEIAEQEKKKTNGESHGG